MADPNDLENPPPAGVLYLDCFFYGANNDAMLGNVFPVQTYGPSSRERLEALRARIGHCFTRTEIVSHTKGQAPLDEDYWPGSDRPH